MAAVTMPSIDCPDPILPAGAQGIERVAVDDTTARLIVTFVRTIGAGDELLRPERYTLTGGRRLFPRVCAAERFDPAGTPFDLIGRRVILVLNTIGDFSIYTLTVAASDVDPFFASRRLRFRLGCDDPFDCREPAHIREPEQEIPVGIDYLAKDYVSFRQALIDFIPTRAPGWTERSEADVGMMLLELLAHTADELSYIQDRVANEAFLATASQRRSVAGHLALIGYRLDEGAAAWTWLQFQVNRRVTLPAERRLQVTNRRRRPDEPLVVFETVGSATFDPDQNAMFAFDWGNAKCCLSRDARSVTLRERHEGIAVGDRLLLEHPDPQDPRRDVVLVTGVVFTPATATAPELTIVHWSPITPLGHEYCIADDSLVVRGNIVLATHGETEVEDVRILSDEASAAVQREVARREAEGRRAPRQRLRLARGPVAHFDPSTLALARGLPQHSPATDPGWPDEAPASISTLALLVDGQPWQQLATLLESDADDRVYRLEIDDEGDATVVFGTGVMGTAPDEWSAVTARYRVGGGPAGNVAPGVLTQAVAGSPGELDWLAKDGGVRNPLPAIGGRALETREHGRRTGPPTILRPLVAVTAADYQAAAVAFMVEGIRRVQRARATFRWTGSWLTITLAIDPAGSEILERALRLALLAYLDRRRLAGYDLELLPAVYVPIDVAVEFCVADGFRAVDVEQALKQALSDEILIDGRQGIFHPDALSFGDRLFVSRLYAAIMGVPGVASAEIVRLARSHAPRAAAETAANLRQGYFQVAADEIVRLDDDRNFPENGTLRLVAKGAA
jgi:hypothetical protein